MTKRNIKIGRPARLSAALLVAMGLPACIDQDLHQLDQLKDEATQFATKNFQGVAGGTPVVGANVAVADPSGNVDPTDLNLDAVTDQQARYSKGVPKYFSHPLTFTLTGGTSMVTGLPPAFPMVAGTVDATATININPFTTFATKAATAMGGFNPENRAKAIALVSQHLNSGLDPAIVADPFYAPADDKTTAILVKSGATLEELVARTTDALVTAGVSTTNEKVVTALAGDLSDGSIDGHGPGADARTAATANVVSAQVLYEAMRNRLKIRGADAKAALDGAIVAVTPTATKKTDDVLIPADMLKQARVAVAAAIAVAPSTTLQTVATTLAKYTTPTSAATLDTALSANGTTPFAAAITAVGNGTATQWDKVNQTVADGGIIAPPPPAPTPGTLALSAATYSVGENGGTLSAQVRRTNGSSGTVSVDWRTLTFNGYGTADYTTDYGTVNPTTLTFADGETSKTITVAIKEDTLVEGNETFSLILANPTGGATLGTIASSVVTIVDNDTAPAAGTLKYPPDTTLTSLAIASLAKPAYLKPITEPVFKTKLTRITDNAAMGSSYARHEYAKRSAWNSDGSRIIIYGGSQSNRFLLDGKTYGVLSKVTVGLGELVWSNINPNRMFAMNGLAFNSINPNVNAVTTLRTFTGYDRCYLGPWEGNVSADDNYAALACQKGSDLVVVIYNIPTNTITTTKTFAGKWGSTNFDWLSISASGKYVAIKWNGSATAYDRATMNVVSSLGNGVGHGDLGLDAAGNDVYVAFDAYGGLQSIRLVDGKVTQLLPTSAGLLAGHVSCRNLKRPGWAYISPYDAFGKVTTKDVYAVKLDGSGTVQRFAQHHSTAGDYNSQPQAVTSMDGTKVMFGSNWGGGESNSYVAEMP